MILINGKEVIDDVRILEDGTFETTDFPKDFWNSNKTDTLNKERFVANQIPYVDFPSSVHVKNEKYQTSRYIREEIGQVDDVVCETGYVDINSGKKELATIKIGNIEIIRLTIKTIAIKGYYSYGLSYSEYVELSFRYEFEIRINTLNDESFNHKLFADTRQRLEYYDQKRQYNQWPIKTLFRNIVPLINTYVECKHPIEQISFVYLNQLLPQKDGSHYNVHPFRFADALDVAYSLQLTLDDNHILVEFGDGLEPFMNRYIVGLLNSILNIDLRFDKEARTYKSNIFERIEYPKEIISLRNYLQCLIYIGIYENFNAETSKAEYLILPSESERESVALPKDYLTSQPKDDFLELFDFIADMEATHIEDGRTRVGRDDSEWKEKTFVIPFKKNFWASDTYINKINELLGIKLEFQEEYICEHSWDKSKNHAARYYYFERYDDDYVAGLACSRHDIGSSELRKKSFYKILDYFMKKYIKAQE